MTTIAIAKNIMAPVRDKVRLATDVDRLADPPPHRCWSPASPTTPDAVSHETAAHSSAATNRIFHGAAQPSRLILPLIER